MPIQNSIDYNDDTSPSILVRLLNCLLRRDSTNSILTKLLLPNRQLKSKPPAPTPDLNTLLPDTPLISGFNQFLESQRPTLPSLTMEAPEFQKLLEAVPKDRMEEVLLVRQREYGEYLRDLEKHRKDIQSQLKQVDGRIMQAANERKQIDQMLKPAQLEQTESAKDPEEDVDEQDDIPRLKRLQHRLTGHSGMITSLATDHKQELVASSAVDMRAIIWDLQSGQHKYTLEGGHQDVLTGVQFHDRFLLTSSLDSRIRMWDLHLLDSIQPTDPQDLCCETTLVGHQAGVTCFQAHDKTLVSAGEDSTVREWDMEAGSARQTIDTSWTTRGDGYVKSLQFYQFALATGSTDGVLRLWDLRTAQPHRQLTGAHSGSIVSLEFDDRSVVTGSEDGTVALWDLRMGQVLQTIPYGSVNCVRLSQTTDTGYGIECWVAAKDPWLYYYSHRSMQQIQYASDYGRLNSQPISDSSLVTQIHCIDQVLVTGDDNGGVKLWQT